MVTFDVTEHPRVRAFVLFVGNFRHGVQMIYIYFFLVAGKHTHFQVCSPRCQHRGFNLFIIRLRLCLTYAVYLIYFRMCSNNFASNTGVEVSVISISKISKNST